MIINNKQNNSPRHCLLYMSVITHIKPTQQSEFELHPFPNKHEHDDDNIIFKKLMKVRATKYNK